jgi:hypothetical protein
MSVDPNEKIHSEQLINTSMDVNATIHARLRGVMFGLSMIERERDKWSKEEILGMVDTLLKKLRGQDD